MEPFYQGKSGSTTQSYHQDLSLRTLEKKAGMVQKSPLFIVKRIISFFFSHKEFGNRQGESDGFKHFPKPHKAHLMDCLVPITFYLSKHDEFPTSFTNITLQYTR